jgi:hypothetical protein
LIKFNIIAPLIWYSVPSAQNPVPENRKRKTSPVNVKGVWLFEKIIVCVEYEFNRLILKLLFDQRTTKAKWFSVWYSWNSFMMPSRILTICDKLKIRVLINPENIKYLKL